VLSAAIADSYDAEYQSWQKPSQHRLTLSLRHQSPTSSRPPLHYRRQDNPPERRISQTNILRRRGRHNMFNVSLISCQEVCSSCLPFVNVLICLYSCAKNAVFPYKKGHRMTCISMLPATPARGLCQYPPYNPVYPLPRPSVSPRAPTCLCPFLASYRQYKGSFQPTFLWSFQFGIIFICVVGAAPATSTWRITSQTVASGTKSTGEPASTWTAKSSGGGRSGKGVPFHGSQSKTTSAWKRSRISYLLFSAADGDVEAMRR